MPFLKDFRGKITLVWLACAQFLQNFEISRAFLRAEQVEENPEKFQNPLHIQFAQIYILSRGKEILELLGSVRFIEKSNFPALLYNCFRTEKSVGNFDI